MREVRQVLCPVDFSDWSSAALNYAAWFCKKLDAKLTLLHVFEMPAFATVPDGAATVATASVEESLRRLNEQLRADLEVAVAKVDAGSAVQIRLVEGVPYRAIVEAAEELGSDLIVMGTQGRTGLSRMLLGSVAERVVRTANCPVLTVSTHKP